MLVNALPSTFLVGGVHDRSSTPLVAAAQALSPRKGTSSAPRASRTKDLFTMSRAGSSVQTLVPKGGLEPPRVAPHAPQTCASASSATSAQFRSMPSPKQTRKPAGRLAEARVEGVADPLPQEAVRENRDQDREARVAGEPPGELDRVLALVQDVAPGGIRRLDPEPEERESGLGQDRGRDPERH